MKIFLPLFLIVLVALVGCKKQPEMGSNLLNITAIKGDFDTKATETAFEVGDKIGLYVNENVGNLPYETLDETSWQCRGFLNEFLTGKDYYATAYYPYSENATNAAAIAVSSGIDFMVSAKTKLDISGNAASGTLQFKHVLSKLVVSIDTPEEIDGVKTVSLDSIIIKNVFRKAFININTNAISNLSDKGDIAVKNGEAIIIPQTVSRIEFIFKMANNKFSKLAYNTPLLLASGKKTTLNARSNVDLYFNSVLDLKNGDAQAGLPLSIFVATGRAWELKSSEPWLTFSPSSGTGKGLETVTVTVTANTAAPYTPRTTKLTLADKTRNTAVSRTVMQNYSKFEISADKPNEIVPKAGKAYTVTINSNKPWSASGTNATITPSTGLGTTTVTINVPATALNGSRYVNATFTTAGNPIITRTWNAIQEPQTIATVEVGGVKWTTANLTAAAQGNTSGFTICVNPQDYGYYWKWGSLYAYDRACNGTPSNHWGSVEPDDYTRLAATTPTTSPTGNGYDYVGLTSSWGAPVGDPCQRLGAEFKTPTLQQWQVLKVAGVYTWTTYNDINGYFFGAKAKSCDNNTIQDGCIFIPAAGQLFWASGSISYISTGNYWASTLGSTYPSVYIPTLNSIEFNPAAIAAVRSYGFPVRCIQQ